MGVIERDRGGGKGFSHQSVKLRWNFLRLMIRQGYYKIQEGLWWQS